MSNLVTISVPATSANLGPGFDCLGLALDLWNQAEFSIEPISNPPSTISHQKPSTHPHIPLHISGFGADTLPHDETNTIIQAVRAFARRTSRPLPTGLNIRCQNGFPPGSGLGSSSSAILIGLLGINALFDNPLTQDEILTFANEIEGHPDNVTPALLGGLTISTVHNGQVIARKVPITPISLAVVVPYSTLSTQTARAALPKQIPLVDAVHNLGRTALVVEAFRTGDLDLLTRVMDDRLHQPYRLPLIPGAADAFDAARGVGAVAVAISGAGPGVIAFADNEATAKKSAAAMGNAFRAAELDCWAGVTRVSEEGARVVSSS